MTDTAIEILGIVAVATMVTSYALEQRHPVFVAIFAVGCTAAAVYAYLIGSYPFVSAEAVWAIVAIKRYQRLNSFC